MTRNERLKLIRNNETINAIRTIANKYGYDVDYGCIEFNTPRIAIFELDHKSFYPTVRLDVPVFEEKQRPEERHWEINASAYGSMRIYEYKLFIHCLTQAQRLVEELNQIDLTKLPIMPEKFDDEE